MSKTEWSGYQSPDLEPDDAGKDAVTQERAEWLKEQEREQAQVEAERMEIYEGGPLPDANFFDHDF